MSKNNKQSVNVKFSFLRETEAQKRPFNQNDNSGIDIYSSQDSIILPLSKIPSFYEIIEDPNETLSGLCNISLKEELKGRILRAGSFNQLISNEEYKKLPELVYYNRVYRPDPIKTNLRIDLTDNENQYESYLHLRSGLATKYGMGLLNNVGVIDLSYKGEEDEILIAAFSRGEDSIYIPKGTRVAQLVLDNYLCPNLILNVEEIKENSRGGFGSTGIN